MKLRSSFYTFFCSLLGTAMVSAQTNLTLDGTSGNNSISTSYSTNGGLNLSLGFFADYLVLGGGGSAGTAGDTSGTGGGGAGGLLTGNLMLGSSTYGVTVGAGGVAPATNGSTSVQGVNGGNSVFGDITALGGGGGGRFNTSGNTGGSGGGAGGRNTTIGGLGTADQGFAGGSSRSGTTAGNAAGGGGGGAGGQGSSASNNNGGAGGVGLVSSITGSSVTYGGGGGGGGVSAGAVGGPGGGGAGGTGAGTNGTNGLGGGGGGAGTFATGGNGGSGVVIVRYQGPSLGNIGGTVTAGTGSAAGYTIHTFSSTGNASFDMSGVNLNSRLGATLSTAITGDGDLTFSGPGTLTLGATNSYTGATTVSSGKLVISGSSNSSSLRVESNATLVINGSTSSTSNLEVDTNGTLMGSGTIGGNTTISGIHSPGNSPGLQTFTDNLTYNSGSNIIWELTTNSNTDRGTNYDGIDVEGDLNFADITLLTLDFGILGGSVDWLNEFWGEDRLGIDGWKIFDVNGTISGFENLNLEGSLLDGNGVLLSSARPAGSFFLSQEQNGIYLNYSAIPEPSTALLGLLGVVMMLRRKRLS